MPFYLQSAEEKIKFAEYIFLNNEVPLKALLMQLVRVVYLGVYIVISLWFVKTYQRKINDNFSDIEKISLNKAKITLYFFLFTLFVSVVSFVLGYQLSYSYNLSNNIIGLFVGIIIYALAYATWNKKSVAESELSATSIQNFQTSDSNQNTLKGKGRSVFVLSDDQLNTYANRLKTAIENDKVFTENEISLTELSNKINIQPYQLSEVISRTYGESFFDFINRHRIEEIKSRLEDPKSDSYSLLGIAMDCGFNSKSSFNTAFKKFTGVTPSEYRKLKLINS
jgi:AraC-like DNA-binding protein